MFFKISVISVLSVLVLPVVFLLTPAKSYASGHAFTATNTTFDNGTYILFFNTDVDLSGENIGHLSFGSGPILAVSHGSVTCTSDSCTALMWHDDTNPFTGNAGLSTSPTYIEADSNDFSQYWHSDSSSITYSYTPPTITPTPIPTPSLVQAINAGGDTQGNYVADTDFSGGTSYSSSNTVDTSGVTNPASQAVYQTVRYGNTFTYTVPNLTANASYTVRLHFNELYWGTSLSGNTGGEGSRVFNVSINGTQALSNYDIYQKAGGSNKAIVESLPATADSNGNISITFSKVTDNAIISGIEILTADNVTPTPTPIPTLPPNSVNTLQLVDGAVTTPKIAGSSYWIEIT